MTQEEIIIGNKLILEFIGAEKSERHVTPFYKINEKQFGYDFQLGFHSSWDWLIPVAKKCIDAYHDNRQDIFEALHKCDMKKLYKAVIEFITWYNKEIKN